MLVMVLTHLLYWGGETTNQLFGIAAGVQSACRLGTLQAGALVHIYTDGTVAASARGIRQWQSPNKS